MRHQRRGTWGTGAPRTKGWDTTGRKVPGGRPGPERSHRRPGAERGLTRAPGDLRGPPARGAAVAEEKLRARLGRERGGGSTRFCSLRAPSPPSFLVAEPGLCPRALLREDRVDTGRKDVTVRVSEPRG